MARRVAGEEPSNNLRSRAVARLERPDPQLNSDASDALRVLYELASSPSTASDALALLHELQVHQVELEIQGEELQRLHVENEALLHRQIQLYEFAPIAYLIVDRHTALREINRRGVALLGIDKRAACGRSLESFMTAESVTPLRAIFASLTAGALEGHGDLQVRPAQSLEGLRVHASVCPDPAGQGFLVGLVRAPERTQC